MTEWMNVLHRCCVPTYFRCEKYSLKLFLLICDFEIFNEYGKISINWFICHFFPSTFPPVLLQFTSSFLLVIPLELKKKKKKYELCVVITCNFGSHRSHFMHLKLLYFLFFFYVLPFNSDERFKSMSQIRFYGKSLNLRRVSLKSDKRLFHNFYF